MDQRNSYKKIEAGVLHTLKIDEFMEAVDIYSERFSAAVNAQSIPLMKDYKNIMISFAGKSIVTLREILVLCESGYPDGALSLARTLYEVFIYLEFYECKKNSPDFPDYIEDYWSNYDIQRYEVLKFEAEYIKNKKSLVETYKKKLTELRAKKGNIFHFTDFFKYVCKEEDDPERKKYLSNMQLLYKKACITLHSNAFGNINRVGDTDHIEIIDTSPRARGLSLGLKFSVMSFIRIVEVTSSMFHFEAEDILRKLNQLALLYINKQC